MTTFLSILPNDHHIDEESPFNDGQPHICFDGNLGLVSLNGEPIVIRCRISTSEDLMRLGLAVDTIRFNHPDAKIDLEIFYLWGRMDRRISCQEPYTLRVLCGFINSLNLHSVSVYCPHSQATTDLLSRYVPFSQNEEDCFFDKGILNSVIFNLKMTDVCQVKMTDVCQEAKAGIRRLDNLSFVYPDVGAAKRFAKSILLKWYRNVSLVTMHKDRDERTGKISGMRIIQGQVKEHCVILDDLCDGGATFKGASEALRASGAKTVSLVIPHGIFSKGTTIEGIDYIYTSNSFKEWEPHSTLGVHKFV